MKQVLTPEDINSLEEKLKKASPAPWRVIDAETVDTVWVSPDIEGNPIALIDYNPLSRIKQMRVLSLLLVTIWKF